ncbi:glycosyltransferase [Streptomyces sp. Lzd4kr]|nr:glycosyltransferase [Streptomyces sp. Lzd4kr]
MTKILVAASPAYGHFAPLRVVAQYLSGRGHDVTLLSHKDFAESAGSGVRFRAFTGEADVDLEAFLKSPERLAIPEGPAQFAWDMRNVFVKAVAGQHRDIQRCIEEAGEEPVVLIHETGLLGAVPSLMGAPGPRPVAAVGLGPVSFTLVSVDTAPFGMGLSPDSTEEGRVRNQAAYAAMGQLMGPAQELFEQILGELGVPEGPVPFFLDSTILKADRFLQLSVEELSYKRSDTPAHVKFVGTLPPAAARSDLPAWWPEVTGAGNLVVVTQGTIANQDFADLIEPTLRALTDFPGLVVAATGRAGEVQDAPGNARVAEFIAFDDLLPHTDVLVTNGGFGAVQQALRHGVPMVTAGLSEEKQENNVRLAATGAAVNLATNRPAADDVRQAVDTVLNTNSYRANAKRLAAEYAKLNALEEIEKAVSEVAG